VHKIEEYEAKDGKVTSKCSSFKPIGFLMGTAWLEIPPEDYYFKSGSQCEFRFKGLDAPFNVVGMPVYKDYYVTHNWGPEASMSFSPNGRKERGAPQDGTDWKPTELLKVELATENAEDPEGAAFLTALLVAGVIVIGGITVAIILQVNGTLNTGAMIGIIIGSLVVGAGAFFLLNWLLVDAYQPGNNPVTVKDGDEAITKVQ